MKVKSDDKLRWGSGIGPDTNLYRAAAGVLVTDGWCGEPIVSEHELDTMEMWLG